MSQGLNIYAKNAKKYVHIDRIYYISSAINTEEGHALYDFKRGISGKKMIDLVQRAIEMEFESWENGDEIPHSIYWLICIVRFVSIFEKDTFFWAHSNTEPEDYYFNKYSNFNNKEYEQRLGEHYRAYEEWDPEVV